MLQSESNTASNAASNAPTSGYTTREVADLIGLTPDQVRHYVRRRLVQPARGVRAEFRFSFQDVVLLRTAKGLLSARVTPRKANRVLLNLQQGLIQANPSAQGEEQQRSLAAMRIVADGDSVVICDQQQLWNAESGQGHLNFDAAPSEPGSAITRLSERNLIVAKDPDELNSDEWYNLGLDLEEVEPKRAPDAYRRAIALDPKNADALVNLGRLYQIKSDLKNAKRYYELALSSVSSHQLAAYNLGTVFDELNEMERAAHYYERAPAVPDAHYNMARISELQGDEVSALRHMRRYRQMLDAET